jgi:hypothetical protein
MPNYSMNSQQIVSTLNGISLYSPIIITTFVFIFSLFSGDVTKGLFYLFWIFVITSLRGFFMYLFTNSNSNAPTIPDICNTGAIFPYTNLTYSTYILCFTMAYLMTPLKMISGETRSNKMNYYVIFFFIPFILFDLIMKKGLSCIESLWSMIVWMDLLSGLMLGALVAFITYGTSLRNLLFINLSSSNVCSKPANQQMRCRIYKNGELVGSTIREKDM